MLTSFSIVVASVVRMFSIPGFGRTSDPTWTNTPTFMWSAIELGVGQTSASIPGIYSGLRQAWPGFRDFTRKHISQKGSKPSHHSEESHKKQNSLSGIAHKFRYHRASMDIPLTTTSDESYVLESLRKDSQEGIRKETTWSQTRPDLNKPVPPLPRKGTVLPSTNVTVIRGPRSPT